MKKVVIIIILFLFGVTILCGQTQKRAKYIGINPSVTVEPFYEKGELDINVIPLVYQVKITNRVDFRISSIVNYGIRTTENKISHIGFQAAFPVFLYKTADLTLPSRGFFLAPGFGTTRNIFEKHINFGLWVEPGYNFLINNEFGLSLGIQYGATHFWYDDGTTKWGNHFGVKIFLGFWI